MKRGRVTPRKARNEARARRRSRVHRFRLATLVAVLGAGVLAFAVGVLGAWTPPTATRASDDVTPTPAAPETPTPGEGPAEPEITLRVLALAYDGTPEPPPPAPTPEPGPLTGGSPEGLRLWSHGDSTSYFMTVALYQIWRDQGGVPVAGADYKVSTGLARPDYFDWPGFVAAEMARYDPDVAVLMVGGNDIMQMGNPETYRARVATVMDLMEREGRVVVWMGQPNFGPGREEMAQRVRDLNAIFAEEAAKRPWVVFVDTYALTSWSDGSFAWEQTDVFGNLVKIRHEDGVHFTSAGGRHLAVGVMGALFGAK